MVIDGFRRKWRHRGYGNWEGPSKKRFCRSLKITEKMEPPCLAFGVFCEGIRYINARYINDLVFRIKPIELFGWFIRFNVFQFQPNFVSDLKAFMWLSVLICIFLLLFCAFAIKVWAHWVASCILATKFSALAIGDFLCFRSLIIFST
jgi:hypothetical protein